MEGEDGASDMPMVDSASGPMMLDPEDNLAEVRDPELAFPSKRKQHRCTSSGGVHSESLAFIVISHLDMKVLPKQWL
jgi:hypothetical protein